MCIRDSLCPLRGGSNGHADRDLARVPPCGHNKTNGGSVTVRERGSRAQRSRACAVYSLLLVALFQLASCKPKASSEPKAVSETPVQMLPPSASEPQSHAPDSTEKPSRPSGPITFTDVTAQAGIHFKHNSGAFGKKYLPETMGSGVCFLDYDNDGWQDILLVNSMDWPGHKSGKSFPALYHNCLLYTSRCV